MKKIAVITGASSGMGEQFVYQLDRQQDFDEIWVIARRKDRLEKMQEKVSAKLKVLALDLCDPASFEEYRQALSQERKVEIAVLVNAAGFGLFGSFADLELDKQQQMIALNVTALTTMTYLSIPYMTKGSVIYQLGSLSSFQPVPYMTVYGAGKAYVLSFAQAINAELQPKGIHVMAVCPGWIKTEFFDTAVRDDTIKYYNRYYSAEDVVKLALKDMIRGKTVSILGRPERRQVWLVKHLPASVVIDTWLKQQKLDKK